MSSLPSDPNQPFFSVPPEPSKLQRYARVTGDLVKTTVILMAWGLALYVACAVAYVGFRVIYWAAQQALRAVGG